MSNERGFSALWTALILFFLMGSAALAVDVSGFYETARADQTTADLACLAGIPDMPGNPSVARANAAENAAANFPSMIGVTPITSGNTTTIDDGDGNVVSIEAPFGGDANKMRVTVSETDPTTFGRVLGAEDVSISQEAYCKVFASDGGDVPFGALPGGWGGGLQAENPCGESSGNCGRLYVPRADTSGAGPTTIKNIAEGLDRTLSPSLGSLVACDSVGADGQCNVVDTNTGVNANALGQGFRDRLDNPTPDALTFTFGGNQYDADTASQVLGSAAAPLTTQPAGWEPWIHGEWGTADVSNHFYWNEVIAKCDSPRLVSFPIVSSDLSWSEAKYNNGDPYPDWPPGNDQMLVVGTYNGILIKPNSSGDFLGNGNLKEASSAIIWFGPDARCVGPDGSTTPYAPGDIKSWRLVEAGA